MLALLYYMKAANVGEVFRIHLLIAASNQESLYNLATLTYNA